MEDKDLPKFTKQMLVMFEVYTPDKKPLSDTRIESYFNVFTHWGWTIEQFMKAVLLLTSGKKYSTFPLPAEIREALITEDQINKAWQLARKAVTCEGSGTSVKFSDPVIHSVIEAMSGWIEFCERKDTEWARKSFYQLYREHAFKTKHPPFVQGRFKPEGNLVEISTETWGRPIAIPSDTELIG